MGLALGDRVCVGPGGGSSEGSTKFTAATAATSGRMGRLRYCGPVEFASGVWVGIELDEAYGKNNGSVNGVSMSVELIDGVFGHYWRSQPDCRPALSFTYSASISNQFSER